MDSGASLRVECGACPDGVLVPVPRGEPLGDILARVVREAGVATDREWLLRVLGDDGGWVKAEEDPGVTLEDLGLCGAAFGELELHGRHVARDRVEAWNAARGFLLNLDDPRAAVPQLVALLKDGTVGEEYFNNVALSECLSETDLAGVVSAVLVRDGGAAATRGFVEAVIERGYVDLSRGAADGATPLMAACRAGDEEVVRLLIAAGVDLDAEMPIDHCRALTCAIYAKAPPLCTLLLEAPGGGAARANYWGPNGDTPLHHAIVSDLPDVALALLKHGADHNARNASGTSALISACAERMPEVCLALLGCDGIDVNHQNVHGTSPLTMACSQGLREVALGLLAAGAEVLFAVVTPAHRALGPGFASTPLIYAVAQGMEDVCEAMLPRLAGVDARTVAQYVNAREGSGRDTALSHAAQRGMEGVVRGLLQAGANPNITTAASNTPLTLAAAGGFSAVCLLLLSAGARVDIRSSKGDTALTFAAHKGLEDVVRALLKAGADPNSATDAGHTALVLAVGGQYRGVCRLLLDAGALERVSKTSAVVLAASLGLFDIGGVLLASSDASRCRGVVAHAVAGWNHDPAGAVDFVTQCFAKFGGELLRDADEGSETLLTAAAKKAEGIAIATLDFVPTSALEKMTTAGDTALTYAAAFGLNDLCIKLVSRGADPTVVTPRGASVLALAVSLCSLPACCAVLAALDARFAGDGEGLSKYLNLTTNVTANSALILAAGGPLSADRGEDWDDVAEWLIKGGADACHITASGETALLWAATYGRVRLAGALLRAGAAVDVRERHGGETPLLRAARYRHSEVLKLLIRAGADASAANSLGLTVLQAILAHRDVPLAAWVLNNSSLPRSAVPAAWLPALGPLLISALD